MRAWSRAATVSVAAVVLLVAGCSSSGGKQTAPTTDAPSAGAPLTTPLPSQPPTKTLRFCADVGIVGAPSGSTPKLALAAFLAKYGIDRRDWVAATRTARLATFDAGDLNRFGYASVTVVHSGNAWSVDGACVGKLYPEVAKKAADAKCPSAYLTESLTALNAGVHGLDKQLVPIAATSVRICRWSTIHRVNDSGLLSPVAPFERETNRLATHAAVTTPTGLVNGPTAAQPTFFMFTLGSQHVTLRLEASGVVSNGVLSADETLSWAGYFLAT